MKTFIVKQNPTNVSGLSEWGSYNSIVYDIEKVVAESFSFHGSKVIFYVGSNPVAMFENIHSVKEL